MRSVGMSDCSMSTTRIRDVTDIKPPFLYRSCLNEFRMSKVSSVMSTSTLKTRAKAPVSFVEENSPVFLWHFIAHHTQARVPASHDP